MVTQPACCARYCVGTYHAKMSQSQASLLRHSGASRDSPKAQEEQAGKMRESDDLKCYHSKKRMIDTPDQHCSKELSAEVKMFFICAKTVATSYM